MFIFSIYIYEYMYAHISRESFEVDHELRDRLKDEAPVLLAAYGTKYWRREFVNTNENIEVYIYIYLFICLFVYLLVQSQL